MARQCNQPIFDGFRHRSGQGNIRALLHQEVGMVWRQHNHHFKFFRPASRSSGSWPSPSPRVSCLMFSFPRPLPLWLHSSLRSLQAYGALLNGWLSYHFPTKPTMPSMPSVPQAGQAGQARPSGPSGESGVLTLRWPHSTRRAVLSCLILSSKRNLGKLSVEFYSSLLLSQMHFEVSP